MVEDTAVNVERVLNLKDKVRKHTEAIQHNFDNIKQVKSDFVTTNSRFGEFLQKANTIMESQQDTAAATKAKIELLQNHLNGNQHHTEQPYMR